MLKKIKSFYLAPLMVLAVFSFVFALNGFYPFGNASVSWCDMNQQVIPLFCNFKDVLSGNSGFFLNFNNAGGMNFFGVFFFFLSSPFTFLVAFFSKAEIPLLMNVLVVLKLCASAVTACVYFESTFKKQSIAFKTVLGVAYALCGYGLMFYQNVIWLDLMYLFPLLLLGIDMLTEKDKPALFLLSLTLCTVVNFYLSYCVYLFTIIFLGIYTLSKQETNKQVYFKLGASAVCSLLVSAVVALPSLLQYFSSGRTSNIIDGLKNCSFFTYTETTLISIFSSGIIFAVLLFLIPRLFEQSKKTISLLCTFAALIIPMFIEPVNRMWHTGSYMSFPVRYGFLAVFVGLVICGEYFENQEFSQKPNLAASIICPAFCVLTGSFILYYVNQNSDTLTAYVKTLWGNKNSFRGLLVIFIFAVCGYFVPLFFARKKLIGKKILTLCLFVVLLAETLCATQLYVVPAKDSLNVEAFKNFTKLEDKIDDDSFYRVNLTHKFADANMTGATGYNSLGHYTSFTDKDYMTAVKHLGYSGYWMEIGNFGGNVLSDALLGVKYTVYEENGNYFFTQNKNVFSLATAVNSAPENLKNNNRLAVLGDVFFDMFGTNPVTTYETDVFADCNYYNSFGTHILEKNGYGTIIYKIDVTKPQHLYFDCFGTATNALVEPVNNSFKVMVNGNTVANSYPEQNFNGTLYLGCFENESVEVKLQLKKNVSCRSFGVFGVDVSAFESVVNSAKTFNLEVCKNTVNGEIPKDFSGNLFLSIPFNTGLKATLDGKEIELKKALTGFTALSLESGGNLKISFVPKGLKFGAFLSLLGILLTVCFLMHHKKINCLPEGIKKAFCVLFMSVFVCAILILYVIPIMLNLL